LLPVLLRRVQLSTVSNNPLAFRICRPVPQIMILPLSVTSTFFFILNVRKIPPTSVERYGKVFHTFFIVMEHDTIRIKYLTFASGTNALYILCLIDNRSSCLSSECCYFCISPVRKICSINRERHCTCN